ncbi:ATP-dependent RNA helicase suv3, mitochondrial [Neolecta irregularis DAH-3]|uniref:RNA helicase n=1 Tax=Neolecta irregularis (strain DAH-3) TaxID=1198029 RepID=A0A1U7LK92_NEOID|nr:ATP-dependent RNA helicase suv3, mitochondrial [Neolecta irregularis DAH-3]|eukprot:OLL23059.1 ATP-dependent RNA helicase suv3, mitochondrial [Neolecta irregularis DAH-3]
MFNQYCLISSVVAGRGRIVFRISRIETTRFFSQTIFCLRSSTAVGRQDTSVPETRTLEQPELLFNTLLQRRTEHLLGSSGCMKQARDHGISDTQYTRLGEQYQRELFSPSGNTENFGVPTFSALRNAHKNSSVRGLDALLLDGLIAFSLHNSASSVELQMQRQLTDMRYPHEWFPAARALQRTWHLHVGPTNSGKTYHALCRLETASSGWYAGPLRLLAHEIFDRLNSKGIACNLSTGEERKTVSLDAKITSSTVEMVDTTKTFDVAVIDEIQMIGDPQRGWAWTAALLGMQATEMHLCGDESVVDVLQDLAKKIGDRLIIHRYNRLGPLQPLKQSLNGQLAAVQKGDCIVTFSRKNIFSIKRSIEELTGLRCALAYGGLPPETKSSQARLFNDPESGYDVLVASDAVGMGLNLSIRRMVFETMEKFNGTNFEIIPTPQIKQIAGRAGRYRAAVPTMGPVPEAPTTGYVTTLDSEDLPILFKALSHPTVPLVSLGLAPTYPIVEHFASLFPPSVSFALILKQLQLMSFTSPTYHLCLFDEKIQIAHLIDEAKGLSVADRYTVCCAPINLRDRSVPANVLEFANILGQGRTVNIAEMQGIDLEAIDMGPPKNINSLQRLESLHRVLLIYFWLAYLPHPLFLLTVRQRYPVNFICNEQTAAVKQKVEQLIEMGLGRMRFVRQQKGQRNFKASRFEREGPVIQQAPSSTFVCNSQPVQQ